MASFSQFYSLHPNSWQQHTGSKHGNIVKFAKRFVLCAYTFLFKKPNDPCTSSTCSQGIKTPRTKPVKAASLLPSQTSTTLLWRTSKSRMSSMKTQSATLHQKPPPLLKDHSMPLLLLCCQVRFDLKSFSPFFCHSCLAKNTFGWCCCCSSLCSAMEKLMLINISAGDFLPMAACHSLYSS